MTLPSLILGVLWAHLDLHPRSMEHMSHSPDTLGVKAGDEPQALYGPFPGKLEKLPSDTYTPQEGSQTSSGECGILLWI